MSFDWKTRVATLPHAPGVYLMKDRRGRVIYIGKAADLAARVRSYFTHSGDTRAFVALLDRVLGDIETLVTRSDKEAILLENHLVKIHQPRYNVRLRDDKNFLLLRIDLQARYPRLEMVRQRQDDQAAYFGPYDSARSIRRMQRLLTSLFQLRSCPDTVFVNRSRPCLLYELHRCLGPCVLPVSNEFYQQRVAQTRLLLEGRVVELLANLEKHMWAASEAQNFERAARLRDQIRAVRRSTEIQSIDLGRRRDIDAFALCRHENQILIVVLQVRDGLVTASRTFSFADQHGPDDDILGSFFTLYYQEHGTIPEEVLLPVRLDDLSARQQLLSEQALRTVRVRAPSSGVGRTLLDLAARNAQQAMAERLHTTASDPVGLARELQRRLHLGRPPDRIECYDISTLQGEQAVGSRVTFAAGRPDKAHYRRYRIQKVAGQDDFAMLAEVLTRRLRPDNVKDDPPPDLLVVDGGRGQLQAVEQVLRDLQIGDLPAVGLAKSRVQPDADRSAPVRHRPERVFLSGIKNPVVLPPTSPALRLLQRLRDEAHRFAIGFHRQRRDRSRLHSALDDIAGVGPSRRRLLLRHFGHLKAVRAATLEALLAVPGLPAALANRIHTHFHSAEATAPQN